MVKGNILLYAQDTLSMTRFFPDNLLTFTKFPDIFVTAIKFPDISRSSRQADTITVELQTE